MLEPLTAMIGDPDAGRRVFTDRDRGHCLLCHQVDDLDEPFQGNLGPDLSTVGARLDAGQLRLRVIDSSVMNPNTVMPPYHRIEGLNQVGAAYRGRPILAAQEVEDLVAFLQTLTGGDADG